MLGNRSDSFKDDFFVCGLARSVSKTKSSNLRGVPILSFACFDGGWVYFYYYRLAGQDLFCCNWSRSYVDTPYARCCRADPVAVHVPILFFSRSLWRFFFFES